MKERLVEDWLINVNERGFEIPFCQTLLAHGMRILRVGHSPFEDGKDVLAESSDGTFHAYQLKSGDVDLEVFEQHFPQITALVEASIRHPNVPSSAQHEPHFVTTGDISEPVISRVANLNAGWQRRGYRPLRLIGRRQLHTDFVTLASDFWPVEPPKVRSFRSLYLLTGRGDFDHQNFSSFIKELLDAPRGRR